MEEYHKKPFGKRLNFSCQQNEEKFNNVRNRSYIFANLRFFVTDTDFADVKSYHKFRLGPYR